MSGKIFFYGCFVLLAHAAVVCGAVFVPSGLGEGDHYQLAFVTRGTRDATSAEIADYNQFVTDQAALPGAITEDYGIEWFAIASTAETDSIDNAVVSSPVYLLDGTLLSTIHPAPASPLNTDQFGELYNGLVWTGSLNGRADVDYMLGSPYYDESVVGIVNTGLVDWEFHDAQPKIREFPLYALSQVLTVPATTAVPEPSSGVLWLSLCGASLTLSRARRRNRTC